MRTPLTVAAVGLGLVVSSLLVTPSAQAGASGCDTGVPSDFNGDGFSDVAVANSTASEAGQTSAGRVTVRYGDADNRVGEGVATNVRADTGNDPGGIVQTGARWGFSLVTADLDCDGFTDLVVGAPLFDNIGAVDSGTVTVLYGEAAGFVSTSRQDVMISDDFGRTRATGDRFGYSVDAVEDLGQGGTPDPDAYGIIIGVPYRDTSGFTNSGAVAVRTALDGGNIGTWIDETTPGVGGGAEAGDLFGFSVAFGFFDDNSTVDALVGVPSEDVGSIDDAGSVVRLDNVYGDELDGGTAITQNSSGVPDSAEASDQFGRVVDAWTSATGANSRAVASAPYENIGSAVNAGLVQLFDKPSGGSLGPGIALSQNTSGVGGTAQTNDYFGSDVAIGPGYLTAIGVPGQNGSEVDSGLIQLVPLANVADDTSYTQASSGVPGTANAGEKLGSAVGIIDGASEDVALAGVPADVENADGLVNVFPFPAGVPRSWLPTGVGGGFGDAFGGQGR
ncbi:VCBS repeat-containing protein [Aeromicrobium sp.]|uniref:VCBS repeat-containing protein n=1 Tax=Aeromicrobium sp. TaxID=1871063 RepID=UPI0030BE857F